MAVCFLEQARIASGSCWGSPWQKLSRCRSGAVRQGPGAGWELSCLCVGTPGWPAGHLARIRGLPEPSCWGHGGSAWRVLCILPQDVICCVLNITVLGLGAACYGILWLACSVEVPQHPPSLDAVAFQNSSVIQREWRNVTFILLMP